MPLSDTTRPPEDFCSLAVLKRRYDEYLAAKRDERAEAETARRYYHGDQWTAHELKVLEETTAAILQDRRKFFAEFFRKFYGVDAAENPVSDDVLEWSLSMTMRAGLKPTVACAESFFKTDFRPDLASFKVPTLIIHGTADQNVSIDASARPAAKGIKSSKLIEYEGSPHGLLATDKQRLTCAHLPFPGTGLVERKDGAYRFMAAT